jgi:hypothetical protein
MNKLLKASQVMGIIAAICIITSLLLLAFIRDKTEVITTVINSATITPGVNITIPPPKTIIDVSTKTIYSRSGIPPSIKPSILVTRTVPFDPTNSVQNTVVKTTGGDDRGPGEISFSGTINTPLISPPQGLGWFTLLNDDTQLMSGFQNGYAVILQYIVAESSLKLNKSTQYPILFSCAGPNVNDPTKTTTSIDNPTAVAVASVGYRSINSSVDALRMYVGYLHPFSSAKSERFPFRQLVGEIAVWSRPPEFPGQSSQSGSTVWTPNCTLTLANPFGSQSMGFSVIDNPLAKMASADSNLKIINDGFGQFIQVSQNTFKKNIRMIASRINYTFDKNKGAAIVIYEETTGGTQSHEISGIIQAHQEILQKGVTLTYPDKFIFGQYFDIGNDIMVANMLTQNEIFVYRRNDTDLAQWIFQQRIVSPHTNENFGQSLCLSFDAQLLIVGSPTKSNGTTTGIGGSVYVYKRQENELWALTFTLKDPTPKPHASFGYWCNTNDDFSLCAISMNQNNYVLQPKKLQDNSVGSQGFPQIYLIPINRQDGKLAPETAQTINQPLLTGSSNNDVQTYIDPTFGAKVDFVENFDNSKKVITMVMSSPMNELIQPVVIQINNN